MGDTPYFNASDLSGLSPYGSGAAPMGATPVSDGNNELQALQQFNMVNQMREQEHANEAPRSAPSAPVVASGGQSSGGMGMPGGFDPNNYHPHINPFMMFNDQQGFGANHPKIAGGIEGALRTVANMGPPELSAGGNISNVARGLIGGRMEQRQYMMDQYMQPLHQLGALLPFYQHAAQMNEMNARGNYYNKMAGAIEEGDRYKKFGTSVYSDPDGHYVVDAATGEKKYVDKTPEPGATGTGKVGSKPSAGSTPFPSWIKTTEERNAFSNYKQKNPTYDWSQGPPPNWASMVNQQHSSRATSSALGIFGGKLSMGDLTDIEKKEYDTRKDEYDKAVAATKVKAADLSQQGYRTSEDRAKEIQRRKDAADAAKKNYDDFGAQVLQNHPKAPQTQASPAGGARPKLTFKPDGTMEIH